MSNPIITLQLDLTDIDMIQSGLTMYVNWLAGGDEEEKAKSKRAEETYEKIGKQLKWS